MGYDPTQREYYRLYMREYNNVLAQLGICRLCKNPAKPGRTRCEVHLAADREYSRRRYRDAKAATSKGNR